MVRFSSISFFPDIRWRCDMEVLSLLILDKDRHFSRYASLVLLSAKSTAKAFRLNRWLNGLTALLVPTKLKLAARGFFQRTPIDCQIHVFQVVTKYWLKHQFRFTAQKHRSPYQQLRPGIRFSRCGIRLKYLLLPSFLSCLLRAFPATPSFRPSSSVGNGGLCDR
jgi:hypothetical protein